jgi:hypothetical protein
MADVNEINDNNGPQEPIDPLDPEDINSQPMNSAASDAADDARISAADGPTDPNDEVPVPLAMWPSEIDERAQVVEALRGNGPPPRTDTQVDPRSERLEPERGT